MTSLWALVPIKCFTRGKSRLEEMLSPEERGELVKTCCDNVVSSLLRSGLFAGVLISTDALGVRDWAVRYGVEVLLEEPGDSLAQVLQSGLRHIEKRGGDSGLMVMGDLPFLEVEELRRVVGALEHCDVVIAPDRRGSGTNLLGFRSLEKTPIHLGEPGSFQAHRRSMERAGLSYDVVKFKGTGFDLDLPEDYWVWRRWQAESAPLKGLSLVAQIDSAGIHRESIGSRNQTSSPGL